MNDCFIKLNIENNTVFYINTDGTYVRTTLPKDTAEHGNVIISQENHCLLQCYSNGHVNKVYVRDLIQLRKDFTYSHGIFPNSLLQYCAVCTDDDFVIVIFEKLGVKYLSVISVSTLKSHTMLGLKGYNILRTIYDNVLRWYILPNEQSVELVNLKEHCSRYGYISFETKEFSDELLWLNNNIIISDNEPEQVKSQTIDDNFNDVDFNFSCLIGEDKQDVLRQKFSDYLKIGKTIPIGQSHVKDILSLCKNKNDFWRVIKCLLECNIVIYRSPIVSYFNSNPDGLYMPDHETLNLVTKLIFSTDEKKEKNLEFLYPFRDLLTQEDLSIVKNIGKDFSKPEHIHILGTILNYTHEDLIDFCLENASIASYYCIYEILQKCYKKEGYFYVNNLIKSIVERLDSSEVKAKLIIGLICNEFKKDKNHLSPDVIKIKSGGFSEYCKICNTYEGKKKHKNALNNITSFVGQRLNATYVATYQNHYFLTISPGIRVLLPKNMAIENLSENNRVASVFIVFADKTNSTLYATQKLHADFKKILHTPLLNNGDTIEVTFDLNGYPIPHKCYKKISISIDYIPKNIDYRARYKAKVIRQMNDKYHYLVKLI